MHPNLNYPQANFLNLDHKYRAFVGGLGSGKTWVGCTAQIHHVLQNPGIPQGYFAPTYSLIRDIFYPTIEEVAYQYGVRTTVKTGDKEIDFYYSGKWYGTTICRTMDRPETIVGFKIGHAMVDEIDVMATDKAEISWRKIIGRLRYQKDGVKNGVDVTTTPEGFKFTYNRFAKEPTESYGILQASTYDNELNLPSDYIQTLKESYPSQVIEAYINGQFVNLVSGTVYHAYNDDCKCKIVHQKNEPIHVGMDFNVRNMSAIINVQRDGICYAVDELVGVLDTPTMIDLLKDRFYGCSIIVRPDASGKNVSSKGAAVSDIRQLQQAGFWVDAPNQNPRIKDRINSVNAAFEKGQLKVNAEKCPNLDLSLQQQIYDKNGMPEKRLDNSIDDINDAFGYNVHGLYPLDKLLKLNNKGNWK